MKTDYVHGYSRREAERLADQAGALTELLHHDTLYPPGSMVLEAGCGTGAQTVILASKSPLAKFTSMDISEDSLREAASLIKSRGFDNVEFKRGDIFNIPFTDESFDHIFVCFVLEHLEDPVQAILFLKKVLKKGGSITVIEGDHGSAYFHPDSEDARITINCLVELQARVKGNSLIGRQVYPLLARAGFSKCSVSPRMVYADSSRPGMVDSFTRKTFIAMVEGVREQALASGMIGMESWEKGIHDLNKTAEIDGTFCYTFFKGVGYKNS